MAGRFYVYRNGVEVKDHPLNGAIWGGSGPRIGFVNGYPVFDTLYHCPNHRTASVPMNAADVADGPVMVKEWFPNGGTKWRVFASAGMITAAGKTMDPPG